MKQTVKRLRPSISVLVAIALAAMFSFSSFAAPDLSTIVLAPVPPQDCTGTLTVTKGTATINGNPAQTGATVLSGSQVATGPDSAAVIDFGSAGRLRLADQTMVQPLCVNNEIKVRLGCNKTEVDVMSGQVIAGSTTVTPGSSKSFGAGTEVTASSGADFSVECEGRGFLGAAGDTVGPGLAGWLALLGIGAGVATGIAVGGDDGGALLPAVSPVQP
jgi:hypothetical protein